MMFDTMTLRAVNIGIIEKYQIWSRHRYYGLV